MDWYCPVIIHSALFWATSSLSNIHLDSHGNTTGRWSDPMSVSSATAAYIVAVIMSSLDRDHPISKGQHNLHLRVIMWRTGFHWNIELWEYMKQRDTETDGTKTHFTTLHRATASKICHKTIQMQSAVSYLRDPLLGFVTYSHKLIPCHTEQLIFETNDFNIALLSLF